MSTTVPSVPSVPLPGSEPDTPRIPVVSGASIELDKGLKQNAVGMLSSIVIGIASVMLLTSLGEGTRQYILSEFTQFGTNLLQISPGRITTQGIPRAMG